MKALARLGSPAGAWLALGGLALGLAVYSLLRWADALFSGAPVLYGEGAVAHAGQLLARGADPYGPEAPGTFVAANYPPLVFALVAAGAALGPFAGLRLVSVASTLAVAALVAWRARASPRRALVLAALFLALFPVQVWGPAHKPDPLAVALAALAVLLAGPDWRRAAAAGLLGALAIYAKPTAALPVGAVVAYLLWRERAAGARFLLALGVALAALTVLAALVFDSAGMLHHLVARNALPYVPPNVALLALLGALLLGALAWLAYLYGDGRMRAYLLGALGVVVLGGREGATINYLLDLIAASSIALAPALARSTRALPPGALAAQLALGVGLVLSGLVSPTGAWADPSRVAHAADLARAAPHLAEDSGVLIANGIEPEVDDLFLWSRLVALGVIRDEVTPRARDGAFATVIAEVRLDALDRAPAYERQRWPPELVEAILANYRIERQLAGHVRYVPKRAVALR